MKENLSKGPTRFTGQGLMYFKSFLVSVTLKHISNITGKFCSVPSFMNLLNVAKCQFPANLLMTKKIPQNDPGL